MKNYLIAYSDLSCGFTHQFTKCITTFFFTSIVLKQIYPILRIKIPMFKQISAKDTNMSKALKKSPSESMVVKLVSMVSHSKFDVVVKIEMATISDMYLKNSEKKKYTRSVHKNDTKVTKTKIPYTMKMSLKRSQSTMYVIRCSTQNSKLYRVKHAYESKKASNYENFKSLSVIVSMNNLIKRNEKSQIRKSQSHPQSHIFQIPSSLNTLNYMCQ